MKIAAGSYTFLAATFAFVALCSSPAHGDRFDVTADLWIRQSSPLTVYENDLLSVRDVSSDTRYTILEFDLSSTVGTTINSAFLQLFHPGDSIAYASNAYVFTTTPPDIADYTWEEYITFDQATEAALQSLGNFDLDAGATLMGYNASNLASIADIQLIESVRDNNSGRVVLVLKGVDGANRDWFDLESGTPPRLVINEPVPIYGDLDENGVLEAADLDVITDPANWLQTVTWGTRGDFKPDGFVNLQDFHAFKQVLLASQDGAGSTSIPEPATAAISLSMAAMGWVLVRRGRTRP